MKDGLIVTALSAVPRKRGARAMGWLARSGLSKLGVRLFVMAYGVDTSTAEKPLGDYGTLEAFFTRRLKPGARAITDEPSAMASPCDAKVAAVGRTTDGAIEVAPGRTLDVAELVGRPLDEEMDVAVLYLSPKDYHRVHVPREGRLVRWSYTPGDLWPVFPAAVRKVDGLFEHNERMAVVLDTDQGPLDVVLVGAFGVGRIELVTTDLLANDLREARAEDVDVAVKRGGDLGVFHLGSTVVLVAPPGAWAWDIAIGDDVRMGQRIAHHG
ncbi:MAG: phosphatidylserine decarboxylase [Deltaproteobacteria bacterium]|nr:MAG: phosphatidylserine decarboxylase [Deltaproteobacteria bacterium]